MNYLKRASGWIAAWTLYGAGSVVAWSMNAVDVPYKCEDAVEEPPLTRIEHLRLTSVWPLYVVYNWLMLTSSDVQDWGGGAGPWHSCECDAYCSECEAEPPLDDVQLEEPK